MAKPIYRINGTIVQPPESAQGKNRLKIQLNFDRDKDRVQQQISLKNIAWVRENYDLILAAKQAGINGGPGITSGIPLTIHLPSPQGEIEIFDGYIDTTSGVKYKNKIRYQSDIKERNSMDYINDVWDKKTYEYLYRVSGEITASDFKAVPYSLNSVPDYPQTIMSLLSVYVIAQQIQDSIEGLIELAAEMANPLEATAILRAVFRIAYLIILIATLLKLIKDTIQLVIQPVKYHKGMFLLDQLQKGAQHLGYTFRCPILETGTTEGVPNSKLFILPQKETVRTNIQDERLLGFTTPSNDQNGFYKGTIGDLFRAAKKLIKGKFVPLPGLNGPELWLVREDENASIPTFVLPNMRRDFREDNMDEFHANYTLGFLTDTTDLNTLQQYQGTVFTMFASNAIPGPGPDLTRGIQDVTIPFALAKRKEDLTAPEKIIKELLDVLDPIFNVLISGVNAVIDAYNTIVGVINKIVNALDTIGIDLNFQIPSIPTIPPVQLGSIIENRIGMLMLHIDNTAVPKIFFMDEGIAPKFNKVHQNNRTALSAKSFYKGYHFIQSFNPSPTKPNGNQWGKEPENFKNVPFSVDNYLQVRLNNKCFSYDGQEAEIDFFEWDPEGQHADIIPRFSEKIGINLIETEIEPDGQ